jgi:CRISPR-associated protein Cas6
MTWDWPENKPEEYTPHMIDLQFDLIGTTIPADNAQMLADALQRLLPWLGEDSGTGIQHLKGAETNKGDATLNINRRTKLFLRVPKARVDDMQQLVGQTLDLAGHALEIGSFKTRAFSAFGNIYAHFVDTGSATEEQFVQDVMRELDGHFHLRCGFICGRRNPAKYIRSVAWLQSDAARRAAAQVPATAGRRIGAQPFVRLRDIHSA